MIKGAKTNGYKLLLTTILSSYLLMLASKTVYAVCPVCTVAVIGGLGLSRWLGIDDSISSIWIGGLILSTSFWLIDWLEKKKFKAIESIISTTSKRFTNAIVIFSMYLLVLIPLKMENIIGHPYNKIAGIDKIVFGTVVGSAVFLLGVWADKKERAIKGKQLFNYQKVIFPVVSLVIVSLLIYYYGGYLY